MNYDVHIRFNHELRVSVLFGPYVYQLEYDKTEDMYNLYFNNYFGTELKKYDEQFRNKSSGLRFVFNEIWRKVENEEMR